MHPKYVTEVLTKRIVLRACLEGVGIRRTGPRLQTGAARPRPTHRPGRPDFCRKRADALQIGMNSKHLPQPNSAGGSALRFAVTWEELPLTVRDAAVYLGVSVQTVYLWVERKQIPHLRVMGRNIRFLKSDLEPFRAAFKQAAVNGTSSRIFGIAPAAPKLRTVEQEEL